VEPHRRAGSRTRLAAPAGTHGRRQTAACGSGLRVRLGVSAARSGAAAFRLEKPVPRASRKCRSQAAISRQPALDDSSMLIGGMNHPEHPVLEEIEWMAGFGLDFIDLTLEPPAAASWRVDTAAVRAA